MSLAWEDISALEMAESYPAAIDAIEERLRIDPTEHEAVLRLAFDLWLGICEAPRLGIAAPTAVYAARFRRLLKDNLETCADDPDLCWVFGHALVCDYYNFVVDAQSVTELEEYRELGERLSARARAGDDFYRRLYTGPLSQAEIARRFQGRGAFLRYYACG